MVKRAPRKDSKPVGADEVEGSRGPSGSQTLQRGLDVLDAVADAPVTLTELAEVLGLTRSTPHRLVAALVERRVLTLAPREGYSLGPKLPELGFPAQLVDGGMFVNLQ